MSKGKSSNEHQLVKDGVWFRCEKCSVLGDLANVMALPCQPELNQSDMERLLQSQLEMEEALHRMYERERDEQTLRELEEEERALQKALHMSHMSAGGIKKPLKILPKPPVISDLSLHVCLVCPLI